MKRSLIRSNCLLIVMVVFMLLFPSLGDTSSCVSCHTNESIMKSLYRPPHIPAGEGEG
ncbi:MAG: hypothetical protein N2572_05250 [Syntrophales bacterium]|nr:hypothetical protein [Syntrophales bacterium]